MGIMEKKMETTIVYWGYIGIMENKMETTIMGYTGFRVYPRSRPSPIWGFPLIRGTILGVPIISIVVY